MKKVFDFSKATREEIAQIVLDVAKKHHYGIERSIGIFPPTARFLIMGRIINLMFSTHFSLAMRAANETLETADTQLAAEIHKEFVKEVKKEVKSKKNNPKRNAKTEAHL